MITPDDTVKLIDFGIAEIPDEIKKTRRPLESDLQSSGETSSDMAPELGHGEDPSVQSDVWSLGVTLFQCLTGRQPFPDAYQAHIMLSKSDFPEIKDYSGILVDLCRQMLVLDPRTRITILELLQGWTQWFQAEAQVVLYAK
jgi:serine/threonine protein kinase